MMFENCDINSTLPLVADILLASYAIAMSRTAMILVEGIGVTLTNVGLLPAITVG